MDRRIAKPLYLQRVERSQDLRLLFREIEREFQSSISTSEEENEQYYGSMQDDVVFKAEQREQQLLECKQEPFEESLYEEEVISTVSCKDEPFEESIVEEVVVTEREPMKYEQLVLKVEADSDTSSDSEEEPFPLRSPDISANMNVATIPPRHPQASRHVDIDAMDTDRIWLQNAIAYDETTDDSDESDSEDNWNDEEIDLQMRLLSFNRRCAREYYQLPKQERAQCKYYSAGLFAKKDLYVPCNEIKTEVNSDAETVDTELTNEHIPMAKKSNKGRKKRRGMVEKEQIASEAPRWTDLIGSVEPERTQTQTSVPEPTPKVTMTMFPRVYATPRPETPAQAAARFKRTIEMRTTQIRAATVKRQRLYATMMKKEISKAHRQRLSRCKEMTTSLKKLAQHCMKYSRQKAILSEKCSKEIPVRMRRLTREMLSFWKRSDRAEREAKRRQEKEALEQRKIDVEFMEAKRQQRKLNFLITQTELYAHFVSKKMNPNSNEDEMKILNQLDEEKEDLPETIEDNFDSTALKERVRENVTAAVEAEKLRCGQYNANVGRTRLSEERSQPSMFKGSLKHYQLKGMNWIANLYDQGINGILADEMGLGKTVQSIAFLCHIAEKYSIWGPFLIISPSSTLHNWQQEMAKFVPDFKVVPYWGSPQERKILRQFWNMKEDFHTKDASFHVVITSYQLVISDIKYFNKIKWEYLILDEAQAIKSTNSMRWKLLLGFSCRNRLLLSGTPIQNSMGELWALLHFIMPAMFDSHHEFNEWFSKDIENHAENKTGIDQKHLTRLHLILKPFMLRRIKKDVENELSDKIEIMVYCPLTSRQKMLYAALRKQIHIEDFLSSTNYPCQAITSNLMNLVMQFRKVCNHPELFERRETKSPFFMKSHDFVIPRLIFERGLLYRALPSNRHLLDNKFNVFNCENVHRSLFPASNSRKIVHNFNCFSFTRFMNLSPEELYRLALNDLLFKWLNVFRIQEAFEIVRYRSRWWPPVSVDLRMTGKDLDSYRFTADSGLQCVFAFQTVTTRFVPETFEHRLFRSRKRNLVHGVTSTKDELTSIHLIDEFPHVKRDPVMSKCQPTYLPAFLYQLCPKVAISSGEMYCASRRSAWLWFDHRRCWNASGEECVRFGVAGEYARRYRQRINYFSAAPVGGLEALRPPFGWSNIIVPDKDTLLCDASKLSVLDGLLKRLKQEGHRVLIFSQMTRMIDLLEEYMCYRKHKYMRLDGSSKLSDRRDMVADFQTKKEIFVFLLSTRAGGLGINLTAADTVIFYDSDWNPTVDQQAMDRTHRLGQTKQVTVYRLICKDTIEERMLQRAREKCEIQRMVISGSGTKSDLVKTKEVLSLLLDDDDIEKKYRQKQIERQQVLEEKYTDSKQERKRKFKKNVAENEILGVKNNGSDRHIFDSSSAFYSATDESPRSSKRGRTKKRGRPFSRNSTHKQPSNVIHSGMSVGSLTDKEMLSRRGRGRPRLRSGGTINQNRRPSMRGAVKNIAPVVRPGFRHMDLTNLGEADIDWFNSDTSPTLKSADLT